MPTKTTERPEATGKSRKGGKPSRAGGKPMRQKKKAPLSKKAVVPEMPVLDEPPPPELVNEQLPPEQMRRRKTDREVERRPAGIGAFVSGLLISGKSTDEVLKLVERQFPGAGTSRASVAWYRSKLKHEGKLS